MRFEPWRVLLAPALAGLLALVSTTPPVSAVPPFDYPPGGGKEKSPKGGEKGSKPGKKGEKGEIKGEKKGGDRAGKKGEKGEKGGKKGGKKEGKGKGSAVFVATTGLVRRTPISRSPSGEARPPWRLVEITKVGFKVNPKAGTKVTVVPLTTKAPSFSLSVVDSAQKPACGQPRKPWFSVLLTSVDSPQLKTIDPWPYRGEDVPIDVAVLFPEVRGARFIARKQVPQSDIPGGFLQRTVHGAIDLDGDAKADVLILQYCWSDPKLIFPECNAVTGRVYRRVKGKWKLIGKPTPC
ncbi:MAG: hypothetical protein O7I42_00130 [Alphaproteobacteria bacterium]|nr:hypothetical protein [Alphaproteobacteria bacterium]